MPQDRRDGLRRWAAPVALLALVTVAVVLIHNGLSSDDTPATSPSPPTRTAATHTTTARKATTRRPRTSTAPAGAEYYVVQSGDTFGSIASRYATTVEQIEALNPGVSSNSLTVGEKIRVK